MATMREMTFKGFLSGYVRNLSEQQTNSLYKLAKEAGESNARLVEPLLLYALFTGKQDVLLQATKAFDMHKNYDMILHRYTVSEMLGMLERHSGELNEEYHKVWRSYLRYKNRGSADDHTKELMRQKVKRLQQKNRVSNYRIYTDLKLNPGNVNAWLKYGDSHKVSLETARKTLHYVESVKKQTMRNQAL